MELICIFGFIALVGIILELIRHLGGGSGSKTLGEHIMENIGKSWRSRPW